MLIVRTISETAQMVKDQLLSRTAVETVKLADAPGRILAEDLISKENIPAFDRSSVDGYAVIAQDTFGCSETMPAMLRFAGEVRMGQPANKTLMPGECQYVPTGGALPPGADAMVMLEDVEDYGDGSRYMLKASPPGAYVVFTGDDITADSVVMPAGIVLRPQSIGTLAALGQYQVKVAGRPKVTILSTGDELVAPDQANIEPGQVRDINSSMLAAAVIQAGGIPTSGTIIRDQADLLQEAIKKALATSDLVLISGGSSVGVQDQVAAILDRMGPPGVLQHGISMKPGKPTIIAKASGKPVFGLPGHPLAALFVFHLLVQPLILSMQGALLTGPVCIPARITCNIPSNQGRESCIPVRLDPVPGLADEDGSKDRCATPIFSKSGIISLLNQSQGYIRIPRECEGLAQGSMVAVCLF